MSSNGGHHGPESGAQPSTWNELDEAIHSKDILTILGMRKDTPRDIPHVKGAIKARLELLRALGAGHTKEIEADFRRCVTAGQELLKKTGVVGNGNGEKPENDKHRVAETVHTTHKAAAKKVPEAVHDDTEEEQPTATGYRQALTKMRENPAITAIGAASIAAVAGLGTYLAMFGKPQQKEAAREDLAPPTAVKKILVGAPELREEIPLPPAPPAFDPTKIEPTPVAKVAPKPIATEVPALPVIPLVPEPTPVEVPVVQTSPKKPAQQDQVASVQPKTDAKIPSSDHPRAEKQKPPKISEGDVSEKSEQYREDIRKLSMKPKELLTELSKTTDPVQKYAICMVAIEKAKAQADIPSLRAAFSSLRDNFENEDGFLSLESKTIVSLARTANSDKLAEWAMTVMLRACQEEQHEIAVSLGRGLPGKLPTRNAVSARKTMGAATKDALSIQKKFTDLEDARKTLQSNPDDATANLAVGMYLFEVANPAALDHLAKVEGTMGALATKTIGRNRMNAQQLVELAREWSAVPGALNSGGIVHFVAGILAEAQQRAERGIAGKTIQERALAFGQQYGGKNSSLLTSGQAADSGSIENHVLTLGTINLIEDGPEELLRTGNIVLPKWLIIEESTQKHLRGVSGLNKWISCVNFIMPPEAQKILRDGKYVFKIRFKRTNEGLWKGEAYGGTAFNIPLPNGKSLSLFLDANFSDEYWKNGKGTYRSGFDSSFAPIFGKDRKPQTMCLDHQRPLLSDDGREYVMAATVNIAKGAIAVDANVTSVDENKSCANFSMVAPATLESNDPHLFGKNPRPSGTGAVWGIGVGGGSVILKDTTIAPLAQQRSNRGR